MLEINAQHAQYDDIIELVKMRGVVYTVKTNTDKFDFVGCHKGAGGVEIMLSSMVDLNLYLENVSGGYGDGEL
jgi:hypothetical protein